MAVQVQVNGARRTFPQGTSLSQVLVRLGIRADMVAVAINHQVVPRSVHADRVITAGDAIEVIRAMGGG